MENFQEFLRAWPAERRAGGVADVTPAKVLAVLDKDVLQPADFLTLLSPAAGECLEALARKAHDLTLRYFGRAVNIFTPLYISDVCTNQCRYCGFNAKNKQPRRHLSVEEAYAEAKSIAEMGFQHILLLTGDAPKLSSPEYIASVARRIKPLFASVGVEVYSLTVEEYSLLVEAGVDSMTMFQETYNPELYAWLHPVGPKHDYGFRLNAPERAARAGMRSLGVGALLGLESFEQDAFGTGLHAWWLQRNFPGVDVSVSIPRICPLLFAARGHHLLQPRKRLHARPSGAPGRHPRVRRGVHGRGRPGHGGHAQPRPVRDHRPPQPGTDEFRSGGHWLSGGDQGLGRPGGIIVQQTACSWTLSVHTPFLEHFNFEML